MSSDPDADVPGTLAPERVAIGSLGPFIMAWNTQILLTGITICLFIQYIFRGRFSRDSFYSRVFVIAVFLTNLTNTALAWESSWHFTTSQDRTTEGVWNYTKVECVMPLTIGLTGVLVQCWFARRTSRLFKKRAFGWGYLIGVGLVILAALAAVNLIDALEPDDAAGALYVYGAELWLWTSAFVDVANSGTLWVLLKLRVANFNTRTDGAIKKLMKLAIETGSYTALFATLGAILSLSVNPNSVYVSGVNNTFWLFLPSLYTINLLTTLDSSDRIADSMTGTRTLNTWPADNSALAGSGGRQPAAPLNVGIMIEV
ncbi:hypothetical protein MNV49_006088 [Pseudohyphozyma bogoriensis]|nr:hypothetical protein MNV49_006088 [Pseudohyphozyma bogoriensis]